jgi:ribosomal protein S18 acetylase RimI-like enzyme
MLVKELDDGVMVLRVESPEEANRWRTGFIGAYQTVFMGPPYHERFYPSEAEGVWTRLTQLPSNITLLAVDRGKVAGFGIAIPLAAQTAVARHLTGLASIPHTFYLAELGVLPEYRARGLGRCLVAERMALIDRDRYESVVLRVSASRGGSYEMYAAMGFRDMGVYMEVQSLRTDGSVRSDRRLLLHCVLSQLSEADEAG